jgi:hypothetical protein
MVGRVVVVMKWLIVVFLLFSAAPGLPMVERYSGW